MQEHTIATGPTERAAELLAEAVHQTTGLNLGRVDDLLLLDPERLRRHLETALTGRAGRVRVAGTLDRRLVGIERLDGRWTLADLSGQPHRTRAWPGWAEGHIHLKDAEGWLSPARVDDQAVYRLSRPVVLLAALYHPENFPLPRFPLGISDVARAARATLMGTVGLADMQLGVTLPDLIRLLTEEAPDILGISATFGQHDLMTELLDAAYALPAPPLVIAGGSLTARNEGLLLDRYPKLLIARGGGELTVQDLLAHWHGDLPLGDVHGIGYNGAARGEGTLAIGRRRTAKPVSRAQDDFLPELDLLPATFEHHGVAQLEASRGCTNFCSFCPRGHKGQWAGGTPADFGWMLGAMGAVFDRHPDISRTLYLVDEEFIGRGPDAVPRALEMAEVLHGAGFKWETSCRIDQVTHPERDFAWHVERAGMWRTLVERGLRRCLFGVESGVDSILDRFNKETGGEQNALAIRTLSALGVPTRYTYITFDHLMTLQELEATYAYQGRTDLLLRPMPGVPVEEIVAGVRDPEWVRAHATGRALHTGISYMLVSMECLIGAAYTKQVQRAGLAGEVRPSMGRQDAQFADWRIGVCSQWAQLWVDRHFALDYTLKSLEKILDGEPRHRVRGARVVLKDAAYTVLGGMIAAAREAPAARLPVQHQGLERRIRALLDQEVEELRERMAKTVADVAGGLPERHAQTLRHEHGRWERAEEWRSINAADPCGT
ncbi:radical SAM protein [Actinacidiphila sp. DG2A-62]|uniref:B12-binding domain-containing radical SAM protein n=1 Tax=Actinacidiphila sp. DG2A-62 TaxID=3108821 RepID=UPI002DB75362|nr:radical SAM protein [Actinacidiphila sp. DG2A-62]MEC3995130.1 radical SAM protein [Actinacidiphila sp. DG2A-62]